MPSFYTAPQVETYTGDAGSPPPVPSPCNDPAATPQKVCGEVELPEVESNAITEGMGKYGAIIRASGEVAAGNFCAIQMIEDSAFSVLTATNWTGSGTGITFPAGLIIYGAFTAFTPSSGRVVGYQSAP